MKRLHTSFILGYHGCSRSTGEDVLAGRASLNGSDEEYDWLGPGIYFWDADPVRAREWAEWKVSRGSYNEPFVIGAVIDLGNCLDLMSRRSLETLAKTYHSLKQIRDTDPDLPPLPQNKKAHSKDEDHLLRFLDCAVIRHLHAVIESTGGESFDSVRGLFTEGDALFPGSGFHKKTHVQVAVLEYSNIKGFFRVQNPRED